VVFWGYLAAQVRRPWFWMVAVIFMVLVPLSRMYLGVHFPTDLLGGYLLGAFLLVLYLRLEPVVERWLTGKGLGWHMGLAVAVPVLLALVYPGGEKHGITACGMLMGMTVGFVLERRWVAFDEGGAISKRLLRFILGEAVLFGLWLGLKPLLSGYEPEAFYRFLRYSLIGLWGGLGAPWVFVKAGLAVRSD
jgi:hypothetical protein